MDETLAYTGLKIETNVEYTPDSLETILSRYEFFCHIDEDTFAHGREHRKNQEPRYYERLKDYMRNDQLLPAYKIQIGVADEYIAVADVMQYRSDMDCFVPLMEKFHELYGFYPKYPEANAGYGAFNNYLFCQDHGMEKFMKFPMYKKETTD